MSTFPTPLIPNTINKALQQATLSMLGLANNAYSLVRVGWQTTGQPFENVADDICYLRAVEDDDPYNRVRDVKIFATEYDEGLYNEGGYGGGGYVGGYTQVTTYTRVWRVSWTLYGPNSFDRARMLRSALFSQSSHDLLAGSNLYFVTDVSAPRRVPEYFNGQWWERMDFEAQFNEAVSEVQAMTTVSTVEVIVENANRIVADITAIGA
jgi:hypothetical protein